MQARWSAPVNAGSGHVAAVSQITARRRNRRARAIVHEALVRAGQVTSIAAIVGRPAVALMLPLHVAFCVAAHCHEPEADRLNTVIDTQFLDG